MTINHAFVYDTKNKQIIAKARGNGIDLIADLPYICALTLAKNTEHPNRYYATIASATIFKSGRIPQSSLELYASMYPEGEA